MTSDRPRLVVIGPLPPPLHGVTISTSLVLANPELQDRFEVTHLDTSDRRSTENIAKWDLQNILVALRALMRLVGATRGTPGVLYLPLSQSAAAYLRDSLFILLGSARGWKLAVHLRGGEFDRFYSGQRWLMRRWIRLTLARVDSLAVLSPSLRGVFEGLVPRSRIAVVANGTPDIPGGGVERAEGRVLFLSNLRRRKGLVEAVQSALLVIERHPTAHFVFAGGWEDAELEGRMRELARPAGGRIRFLQPVSGEEKWHLLRSASIALFCPVEPEGHPRTVLEAIAAGLPLVTTDQGAIAETVVDGESGFVLDDTAPERIAAQVLALLDDPDLRDRVGRAARDRYLAAFTQETADRRLAEWLEGLVVTAPARVGRLGRRRADRLPADAIAYFDSQAETYRESAIGSPVFHERFRAFRELIHDCSPSTQRGLALDLGSGDGTLSLTCAQMGYETVAVDGSAELLAIARGTFAEHRVPVRTMLHSLPLGSETAREFVSRADLVIASSVIEYLDDDVAFLRECASLLAPGGTLIASFPNAESVLRRIERGVGRLRPGYLNVQRHQYTRADVDRLCETCGLFLHEVRYFAVPVSPLQRLLGARRPRRVATLFAGVFHPTTTASRDR